MKQRGTVRCRKLPARGGATYVRPTVRKVLVDMYVAPATRRWGTRILLALAVAIAIGYVPAQVLARDPRAAALRRQVEGLEQEIGTVEARNVVMIREIEALRADVRSIERRARIDLGMVYPHELVLRLARPGEAVPAGAGGPAAPLAALARPSAPVAHSPSPAVAGAQP